MSLAKAEANENIENSKKGLKYEYKVNMNILIPKMTRILIECLYEVKKRTNLFDKAMKYITKNIVPIRLGRSFPRKESSRKNKFPVNRKRLL